MRDYLELINDVFEYGKERETRTGKVLSVFDMIIEHHMDEGFPLLTTKRMNIRNIIGEALWFLSGKTDLDTLRKYSNLTGDAWTIWTDDAERYAGKGNKELGSLYGEQWRNYNKQGIDQIDNLIKGIKADPNSRYHIVNAWNPVVQEYRTAALMPCHVMFQVYISDGYMDLKWVQRSVDCFLGLPYNLASYAFILKVLCQLTGYKAGTVIGTLGDTHIYCNHLDAVDQQMKNKTLDLPELVMPEFSTLDELLKLTANDFVLNNYNCAGKIKAELSVG